MRAPACARLTAEGHPDDHFPAAGRRRLLSSSRIVTECGTAQLGVDYVRSSPLVRLRGSVEAGDGVDRKLRLGAVRHHRSVVVSIVVVVADRLKYQAVAARNARD